MARGKPPGRAYLTGMVFRQKERRDMASNLQQGSEAEANGKTITVEIYADIICPWCYIGKRRLEAAFAARPDITPVYHWRAFLLNPTMPREGMDRDAYLHAKFGHSAAAVYGRIASAGMDSGISFRFDDIRRTPDSRAAQRLLIAAGTENPALAEALLSTAALDPPRYRRARRQPRCSRTQPPQLQKACRARARGRSSRNPVPAQRSQLPAALGSCV